jgi:hypothetical protein
MPALVVLKIKKKHHNKGFQGKRQVICRKLVKICGNRSLYRSLVVTGTWSLQEQEDARLVVAPLGPVHLVRRRRFPDELKATKPKGGSGSGLSPTFSM